jgi:predicted RNA binding protein YcfA (HicA-like mRNA interferase family)
MGDRLPRLKAREVEAVLSGHGFVLVSQRGSHRKWRHPDTRAVVTVPEHAGRELPVGTLAQIMKASNIAKEAWKK